MNGVIQQTKNPHRPAQWGLSRNAEVNNGRRCSRARLDSEHTSILRSTALPWEILESAHFLFNRKDFEKTTVPDICRRIDIKPVQFYCHFDSLDEVLEILWTR